MIELSTTHWLDAPWPVERARAAALDEARVLLTWRCDVTAEMLASAPALQLVQVIGPGNSGARVDLEAARRLGIYVASVPDYASDFWAEHTIAALEQLAAVHGWRLRGRRLGLVGLGQVGRRVALLAERLGMRVLAFDPFAPEEAFAFQRVDPVPSLAELLGTAQVVSLHLPLIGATRGLLCAERLKLMASGSLLLNFSAPELVDSDGLTQALNSGHPAAGAFAGPLGFEHPGLIQSCIPDPWPEQIWPGVQERLSQLLRDFAAGQRPPHLLIDPPCPRHAMVFS